ncbi:MAG: hypothetical protein Q9166_008207 [cf. Caloplaca sp. 2 TL-2023]
MRRLCLDEPEEWDYKYALLTLTESIVVYGGTLTYGSKKSTYLTDTCVRLREEAPAMKNEGLRTSVGNKPWTTIRNDMEKEDAQYKQWFRQKRLCDYSLDGIPGRPAMQLVAAACYELEDDPWHMRSTIEWFTNRNKCPPVPAIPNRESECERLPNEMTRAIMAIPVAILIEDCEWEELGKRLWWDLKELPSVFETEDQGDMIKALEVVENRYFRTLRMEKSD